MTRSTRSTRRILFLGVVLTAGLIVVATINGAAGIGPIVFWAVHHTADAEGSTVALRPGLGLVGLWLTLSLLMVASRVRRS